MSTGNLHLCRGITTSPTFKAAGSATGASAGRFGKGKGVALAGTGDAVKTLSRD